MSGAARVARLRIARDELREPVLERIVGALAAGLDMPIDRLSDAQIASAAVAAVAGRHLEDGVLSVDLAVAGGALTMAVGDLAPGAARRLLDEAAVPGVGPVLERLVDRWEVERLADGRERLRLTIEAGAPASS